MSAMTRRSKENRVPHLIQHPCVVQALKAASKRSIQVPVQKLPLSHHQLASVVRLLSGWQPPALEFTAARDCAHSLVGWDSMLRSSELVAIQWEDLHFFPGQVVRLFVPASKNDPGEGAWVFLVSAQ